MSGVFINVNLANEEVLGLFNRYLAQSQEPGDMLDEIGAYLDSETTIRFNQGVEPDGTPWLPSQRAQEEGGKTLIDRGILVSSITHNVDNKGLTHGLTEVYAAIHHFGGEAGRNRAVTLPARPIIGIAAKQQVQIESIVLDWMQGWNL